MSLTLCPSVRLSVTLVQCIERLKISTNFLRPGCPIILASWAHPALQISKRNPSGGQTHAGRKNSQIFGQYFTILETVQNTDYGTSIKVVCSPSNHAISYEFEWPWKIISASRKVSMYATFFDIIAQKSLQGNYVEKKLHTSTTDPLKLIGSYVWTKVWTVIFQRRYWYCSRSTEDMYAHNA